MKKKLMSLLLSAAMIFGLASVVSAQSLEGGKDWYVNFTGTNPLDTNFSSQDMTDLASDMEPGDNVTFTIAVKNTGDKETTINYYLKNTIVKSFEDSDAKDALYTYRLSYVAADGTNKIFYSSDAVGGDESAGLQEVDTSLENFFFLDQLDYGETGTLTLYVELDGETQKNDYQNTMAELSLQFQAEEVESKEDDIVVTKEVKKDGKTVYVNKDSSSSSTSNVQTNDPTQKLPFIILMAAAGAVVLILAIILLKRRKKDEEEEES